MNEQKGEHQIEWTHVHGWRGYTWNPTTGCLHGCTWEMPGGKVVEPLAHLHQLTLARLLAENKGEK